MGWDVVYKENQREAETSYSIAKGEHLPLRLGKAGPEIVRGLDWGFGLGVWIGGLDWIRGLNWGFGFGVCLSGELLRRSVADD